MPSEKKKEFTLRKLYFLLITLTGIVGSIICLGGILYQVLSYNLISSEEYFNTHRYEFSECEMPKYNETLEKEVYLSTAEVETCKEKMEDSILIERSADMKDSLIGFVSWGLMFLILLTTHLPAFLKSTKE